MLYNYEDSENGVCYRTVQWRRWMDTYDQEEAGGLEEQVNVERVM